MLPNNEYSGDFGLDDLADFVQILLPEMKVPGSGYFIETVRMEGKPPGSRCGSSGVRYHELIG